MRTGQRYCFSDAVLRSRQRFHRFRRTYYNKTTRAFLYAKRAFSFSFFSVLSNTRVFCLYTFSRPSPLPRCPHAFRRGHVSTAVSVVAPRRPTLDPHAPKTSIIPVTRSLRMREIPLSRFFSFFLLGTTACPVLTGPARTANFLRSIPFTVVTLRSPSSTPRTIIHLIHM
jgi:hypothetical protein